MSLKEIKSFVTKSCVTIWLARLLRDCLLVGALLIALSITSTLLFTRFDITSEQGNDIVLVSIGILSLQICLIFIKHIRFPVTRLRAILWIEKRYPNLKQRLVSTYQLAMSSSSQSRFSERMLAALFRETRERVQNLSLMPLFLVNLSPLAIRVFLGATLCWLVVNGLFLSDACIYSHTLLFGSDETRWTTGTQISVYGPSGITARNSDIDLKILVQGRIPPSVTLWIKEEPLDWEARTIDLPSNLTPTTENQPGFHGWKALQHALLQSATVTYTIENAHRSFDYYVTAGMGKSPKRRITVTAPPSMVDLRLSINYPEYLGKADEVQENPSARLQLPVGTELLVEAHVESQYPLPDASIQGDWGRNAFNKPNDALISLSPMKVDVINSEKNESGLVVSNLAGQFELKDSCSWIVTTVDEKGLALRNAVRYTIDAVPDKKPEVRMVKPGKDVVLRDEMKVQLVIDLTDDHGLTHMEIPFSINESQEEEIYDLRDFPIDTTQTTVELTWDLEEFELFPGDLITYYAIAWDNYPKAARTDLNSDFTAFQTTGQSGVSGTYQIRFPTLGEIYEQVSSEDALGLPDLSNLMESQESILGQIKDNLTSIRAGQVQQSGQQGEKLERIQEQQQQLAKESMDIVQNLEKNLEQIKQQSLTNLQIYEKAAQIQDLLNELLTEDMKRLMQQLHEALNNVELSEEERQLFMAQFSQEEFLKGLERTAEMLQNLKQDLFYESLKNMAANMSALQDEVLDETQMLAENKGDHVLPENSQYLAGKEKRLEQNLEEFKEILDKAIEASDDDLKQELGNIKKELEQSGLTDTVQKALEALQKGDLGESKQMQENASKTLNEMSEKLQNLLQQTNYDDLAKYQTAIQEAINDMLALSKRMETLFEKITRLGNLPTGGRVHNNSPSRKLSNQVRLLLDSFTLIQKNLNEIAAEGPYLDQQSLVWLQFTIDNLNKHIAAQVDKGIFITAPMLTETMGYVNQGVLALMDSLDSLAAAQQMMSLDQMLQNLDKIAKGQMKLNRQCRRMIGRPMPMPQPQLSQMAFEQQMLRQQLEGLKGNYEKFNNLLGDIDSLTKEMGEIEKEMEAGNITDELVDRQQRLYHRLLDAQKALRKQGYTRHRKAEPPEGDERAEAPEELPSKYSDIIKEHREWMDTTDFQNLPLEYQEAIKAYFKNLSQDVERVE